MQAALAALPELPALGHQPETAPVRRARWFEHELGAIARRIGHQHAAAADHLALRTGPGTDARIERPAVEVGVAFLVADLLDPALDAHHALQLHPVELQGGERVAGQFVALAAFVIGVPDDAPLVIALDQHDAGAGAQVVAHGGQGHGVGLRHLARDGLVEPFLELAQGLRLRGVFTEFCALVALAQVGNGRWAGFVAHGPILPAGRPLCLTQHRAGAWGWGKGHTRFTPLAAAGLARGCWPAPSSATAARQRPAPPGPGRRPRPNVPPPVRPARRPRVGRRRCRSERWPTPVPAGRRASRSGAAWWS